MGNRKHREIYSRSPISLTNSAEIEYATVSKRPTMNPFKYMSPSIFGSMK